MEFQIAEAIELVKTLAETENLTHTQALTAFFYEADVSIDDASIIKAAFFEEYTLADMAGDSLTTAMHNVFVAGLSEESEELSEVDTKETGEGTKYKVRVKDRNSQSSYTRYATRAKIAELRANPNIASVELTDYGSTGEDDDGSKTAAAKGGGSDRDGDGKVESGSKEHAGVVHNAIQRKKGGTPDGQDTRKEAFDPKGAARMDAAKGKKKETQDEIDKRLMLGKHSPAAKYGKKKVDEAADFNGSAPMDAEWCEDQKKKDEKSPSSKDRRHAVGKFRPGASKEERAEGGRDAMREKGTSPKKNGKKMYEAYLELRENRRAARAAGGYKDDSKKQTDPSKAGFTGISGSIKDIMKQSAAMDKAKAKKKVDEGYKGKHGQSDKDHMDSRSDAAKQISGDSETSGAEYSHRSFRGIGKPAKPGERQKNQGRMTDADRNELAIRKNALKKKTQKEDFLPEGDLVDAGSENQGERDKKKLTGKGVDNTSSIKLMPVVDEAVVTEHSSKSVSSLAASSRVNESLRAKIQEMSSKDEEMCDDEKKEEKPKRKKKADLDESGMPILEYSRNNAAGPTKEMIDPEKDPEGEPGVMNPKGKPKRYKNAGEAPGDRRPNAPGGPELPFDKGTVPNGSGV